MERSPSKRSNSAYEYVKNSILDGAFASEQWLPIDVIAADLRVSRQPVMDSMKRLAIEGFVTIVSQVGCRLRRYEPKQIDDFFRLFADGEALVADLAAQRADADDVIDMRAISTKIGHLRKSRMTEAECSRSYRGLNRNFHLRMRQTARSPVIAEIVESLGDRSDFFVAQAGRPIFAARLNAAHKEHEALLAAISAGKAELARNIMCEHILAIGERLRDRVDIVSI